MEEQILTLAASLCITYAEAEEMILEANKKKFMTCVCPYTGTIEYMEILDDK